MLPLRKRPWERQEIYDKNICDLQNSRILCLLETEIKCYRDPTLHNPFSGARLADRRQPMRRSRDQQSDCNPQHWIRSFMYFVITLSKCLPSSTALSPLPAAVQPWHESSPFEERCNFKFKNILFIDGKQALSTLWRCFKEKLFEAVSEKKKLISKILQVKSKTIRVWGADIFPFTGSLFRLWLDKIQLSGVELVLTQS